MNIIKRFVSSESERDPGSKVEAILKAYQKRSAAGELRNDDQLFLDLKKELPENAAQTLFEDFRCRRSQGHPKAELLLKWEFVVAISDFEHYKQTFKPIIAQPESAKNDPESSPPSAETTNAKALAGQKITSADEDAVLFDELLRDED